MDVLADSNITKRALAAALKELMEEFPFIKISVADICAKCDINRKTFYYHFKDKYDLVNWIYDTEFMEAIRRKSYTSGWEFLEDLCDYLYANKTFYRRVLKVKGQNSFSEHFRELLLPVLTSSWNDILVGQNEKDFYVNFFADAYSCSIERWLLEENCIDSKEFFSLLKSCALHTSFKIIKDIDKEART